MAKCQICKKTNRVGRNASHAMNKTARKFSVNIQKKTVVVGGLKVTLMLCGKCIKRMKKDLREKSKPKSEKVISKPVSTNLVSKTKTSSDRPTSKSSSKKKVAKSKKA